MDQILDRLVEQMSLGKLYNPDAFYMRSREFHIEWMCTLCSELQHQKETFHHSVSTFDAYMQMPNIVKHIKKKVYFRKKSENDIIKFIAATCVFISAKYHEMTYPGINQLLEFIRVPFTYDEFVAQECDILDSLDWHVQFISTYDILTHFLCQGILFSTDNIRQKDSQHITPIDKGNENLPHTLNHNSDVFLDRCLKKYEFLEYDRLTFACGIIMATRKVSNLADLWPEPLVAMTGDRMHYP